MGLIIGLVAIAVIILIGLSSCVKIVPQASAFVIERLGGYQDTWSVGLQIGRASCRERVCKYV